MYYKKFEEEILGLYCRGNLRKGGEMRGWFVKVIGRGSL